MTTIFAKAGERYGAFTLVKKELIDELKVELYEVVHEPTGAHIVHLANDDKENVFCLSFRTWPKSSNGAPHVLEHTALCGSKRFPVKDPFFSMHRRSLNTFMNAFTGPDFTCYPAASQIEQDFYNILDVYLDAVFHPQLKKNSFLQEGVRLEFAQPDDPSSELTFQGVVYNEMKGTFASPMTRFWNALLPKLFQTLPYTHNSGGAPAHIPELTYEELINFHETFYHPGNCLFYFYGNLPLKKHLDFIEERALKSVKKTDPLPSLPSEKRLKSPLSFKERYPIAEKGDLKNKAFVATAFLTAPIFNQDDVLALSLIDSILMDTDASLLKKTLLSSNFCTSAEAFLDTEMSEVPYVLLCRGCSEENAPKLQQLIKSRLSEIASEKIPEELIQASLHQLEFARTEIVSNHMPYGLTLFMRSALSWQHGCRMEDALKIHSLFDKLRLKLKEERFLPSLIEKYLLHNPHTLYCLLSPSLTLEKEEREEEKKRLQRIHATLSQKEKGLIVQQAEQLKKYQRETERQSLKCLPKLKQEEIPLLATEIALHQEEVKGLTVFHHSCFTNQIVYADCIFDLPHIEEEDLPLLHLFTTLITEVGCKERSYADNLGLIHAYTGGFEATTSLHIAADNPNTLRPCLQLHGKALYRNAEHLFTLMREMLTDVRLDEKKRLEELIFQLYTSLENRLSSKAQRYAIQECLSGFGPGPHLTEQWYGLPFYRLVRHCAQNMESELPKWMEKLEHLKEKLLGLKGAHLILSCDESLLKTLHKEDFYGLTHLPQKPFKPFVPQSAKSPPTSRGYVISSPVAFTARGHKTIAYLHPLSPALYLGAQIMENVVLHRLIREEGGAYGSGAHFSSGSGTFYFSSYRDPHLTRTLSAFDTAIDTIAAGKFEQSDLEEAKFGMIQGLDAPIAPGLRALTAYSRWREGKTEPMRQHFRNRLLSTTKKEVCSIVERELSSKKGEGITIAFAGNALFEEEAKRGGPEEKPLPIHTI